MNKIRKGIIMEIERKYTIKKLPEDLSSYTCLHMEQAYLCTDPVVRIRKENDDYFLTYKGKGLLAREEANLPLHEEGFAHLLTKADGLIIQKDRYLIPIDEPNFDQKVLAELGVEKLPDNLQLKIELDIFKSPSGLIMAEVEFPSVELANAYQMPDWFDEDVTSNKAYHNSNISKGGPVFDPMPSFLEDGN